MLSLACAAYTIDRKLIDTFEVNFEVLPEATQHEKTIHYCNFVHDKNAVILFTKAQIYHQTEANPHVFLKCSGKI